MRLLRVLDLAGVLPRGRVDVLGAVQLPRLVAGGGDRGLRQRGRVRTHVGDVAALVEALRDLHGAVGVEPQLAARLLLQGRRHERGVGLAGVGLLLDGGHRQAGALQARHQGVRPGTVEHGDPGGLLELPLRVEVAAGGDAVAVDGHEARAEGARRGLGAGVELRGDVPVPGGAEGDALALPVDDDAGRDRLDAAGGQALVDLAPQHGADLVAVEAVEDAAGLLRVDEVHVELARLLRGGLDGLLGDLVEDHPLDRDLGLEHLLQVPRDGLALAVTVRREVELVGLLEQGLQLGDGGALAGGGDVVGLELVVHVDAEAGPGLALVGLGQRVVAAGEVADVAHRRADRVVRAEEVADLLALGGGLHDHQTMQAVSSCCLPSCRHGPS